MFWRYLDFYVFVKSTDFKISDIIIKWQFVDTLLIVRLWPNMPVHRAVIINQLLFLVHKIEVENLILSQVFHILVFFFVKIASYPLKKVTPSFPATPSKLRSCQQKRGGLHYVTIEYIFWHAFSSDPLFPRFLWVFCYYYYYYYYYIFIYSWIIKIKIKIYKNI